METDLGTIGILDPENGGLGPVSLRTQHETSAYSVRQSAQFAPCAEGAAGLDPDGLQPPGQLLDHPGGRDWLAPIERAPREVQGLDGEPLDIGPVPPPCAVSEMFGYPNAIEHAPDDR